MRQILYGRVSVLAAVSAVVVAVGVGNAQAQKSVADFYKGKTITLTHTGGAGGSFAVYTRIASRHMGKHIPGHPSFIVQFKSGGGGIVGMNYMYNAAPKDGSFILMPNAGVESQPLLFPTKVRYDINKVHWLGNITQLQSYISTWTASGVKSIADLKKGEVIFGATGKGSETYITPSVMNELLGTKIKIITGYKGIAKVNLAMEKGEVVGRGGGWTATMKPSWFGSPMKINILAQVGLTKLDRMWDGGPDLTNVPLLLDLGKTEEEKALLALMSRVLTRTMVVEPGVPADRVDALRKAFAGMMKDPAFLAEMKQRKMPIINPMTWQQVTAYVHKVQNLPPSTMARYKKALGR